MRMPLKVMKIRIHQRGRWDPHSNTFGNVRNKGSRFHTGWDLEAAEGTAVYAISGGNVVVVQKNHLELGNYVVLGFLHKGKDYWAIYAHLSGFNVPDGIGEPFYVVEGTVLGFTGRSGNAAKDVPPEESHLHFGIATRRNFRGRSHPEDFIDPGEILGCGAIDAAYGGKSFSV